MCYDESAGEAFVPVDGGRPGSGADASHRGEAGRPA